jgi:hypothetical protein
VSTQSASFSFYTGGNWGPGRQNDSL